MFNLPLIRVHTELIKTKVDTRVDEFVCLHFACFTFRVKPRAKNLYSDIEFNVERYKFGV